MFLSTYSTSSSSYKSKKFVGALHTELVLAHHVELLGARGTPHHVASPVGLASSRPSRSYQPQGGIFPDLLGSCHSGCNKILSESLNDASIASELIC